MLAILAMITLTVLEYIHKFLKLKLSNRFYQKSLDRPNITYIVGKITKPKYKDLALFILESSGIGVIPKTRVFVDNIEDI